MRWVVVILLAMSAVAVADDQPTPAMKKAAAAHRKTAQSLVAKHKVDLAIHELELSIEQVPDPDALFELARLYDQLPDEDKAFATYQRIADGPHAADAKLRIDAITAARAQRAIAEAARAEAEAKAKAEQEARDAAAAAAEAQRKADEERQGSEAEDRQRRSAEADARDAQLRKALEQRSEVAPGSLGAVHGRRTRHDLGVKLVEIGLACAGVAGVSAGFALISDAHGDKVGVQDVTTYGAYGFAGAAALTMVVGAPLIVF